MKAFHLSQQWDAKLGFDLACYKVELGSFDFFFLSVLGIFNHFYFLNGFVIFSFPIFSSWLIWRWKRQFVLFFQRAIIFTFCFLQGVWPQSCFFKIAVFALHRWLQESLNHCIFYSFDQNNRKYELPYLLNFYWR